jgi:hypothetical protein
MDLNIGATKFIGRLKTQNLESSGQEFTIIRIPREKRNPF